LGSVDGDLQVLPERRRVRPRLVVVRGVCDTVGRLLRDARPLLLLRDEGEVRLLLRLHVVTGWPRTGRLVHRPVEGASSVGKVRWWRVTLLLSKPEAVRRLPIALPSRVRVCGISRRRRGIK
jgi:hypothetical protein